MKIKKIIKKANYDFLFFFFIIGTKVMIVLRAAKRRKPSGHSCLIL